MYELYLWWTLCPFFHDCHLLNICDSNDPEFGLCFAAGSAVLRTNFTAWWKPWPHCHPWLCAQWLHQLSLLHRTKKKKKGKLLKSSQNPFWSLDSNFSWFFFFSNYWIQGQPLWGQPGLMEGIPAYGRDWAGWPLEGPSSPPHSMILWFMFSRCSNIALLSFHGTPGQCWISSAAHRWPTAQHDCPRPLSRLTRGAASICLTSKVALFSQQCVCTGIIASINNRALSTRSKDSHKKLVLLHPPCISYAVLPLLFFSSPKW